MITSSNGNIFRVSGPLCGEFTCHRWIARTKASDAELCSFLWTAPWINGWVNNREAGDLRRHRAHYDDIVMENGWCNLYAYLVDGWPGNCTRIEDNRSIMKALTLMILLVYKIAHICDDDFQHVSVNENIYIFANFETCRNITHFTHKVLTWKNADILSCYLMKRKERCR